MFGIDAPRSVLTNVAGWETENEQHALKYLAERIPDKGYIIEIGSEYGMSTSILAKYSKPGVQIVAVDPQPDEKFNLHKQAMIRLGVLEKVWYQRATSVDAASMWKSVHYPAQPPKVDLLFIDGDHTTEGVIADITAWFPYVRQGGVVVFHDTMAYTNPRPHEQHTWVQAAVDKIIQGNIMGIYPACWRETVPVDSMRIFVRVQADDEGKEHA